jgi:molecular chaperone GrpE
MSKDKKHHPTSPAPPAASAPVPVSEQELAALKEKVAKADESWDRFLRAAAELENYKKRVLREKEELARATREQVVAALLPVLDNLERAIAHAEKPVEGAAAPQPDGTLLDGLRQIHSQFRSALAEFGLEEVVAQAGHPFDPNFHEAVGHVESAEHPEGVIIEQLQRGYNFSKRLLRPARVVVSKGPTNGGSGSSPTAPAPENKPNPAA